MNYMKTLAGIIIIALSSCSKYTPEGEEEESLTSERVPVEINVRAISSELTDSHYPISVYVFDTKGKKVSAQEVTSQKKTFTTKLSPGQYTINAFSGHNNSSYTLPEQTTPDSEITINNNISFHSPLMAGHETIDISKDTSIPITLRYKVAGVRFTMSDIPEDTRKVEIEIKHVSKGYTLGGEYTMTDNSATIECKKSNDGWQTEEAYIFPSGEKNISLDIHIERSTETESYHYNINKEIKANGRYRFNIGYKEGVIIVCNFDIDDWDKEEEVNLDFTEDTDISQPETEDIPTFYTSKFPEKNTIWEGHLVWHKEAINEKEIKAVIISSDQWYKVLAQEATNMLKDYEKDGITGWRTFTEEEVRLFHNEFKYEEALDELNNYLSENGHNIFYRFEKERYLCKEEKYTFNIMGELRINPAGKKTEYCLRPVKTIRIRLK